MRWWLATPYFHFWIGAVALYCAVLLTLIYRRK